MKFHVFELTPSDKIGIPQFPLVILKQISHHPFLDYKKTDVEGIELSKVFSEGFRDSHGDFSVCQAIKKNGEKIICYVKVTGRVVFCKEIFNLLSEIKETERILKDCLAPLQESPNGNGMVSTIRNRLNFFNAIT